MGKVLTEKELQIKFIQTELSRLELEMRNNHPLYNRLLGQLEGLQWKEKGDVHDNISGENPSQTGTGSADQEAIKTTE